MWKWEKEGKVPRHHLGEVLASIRDKLDDKAATTATTEGLKLKLRRILGEVLASIRDKLDDKAATTATTEGLKLKLRRIKDKYKLNTKRVIRGVFHPPKITGLQRDLYLLMEQFFLGEQVRIEEEARRKKREEEARRKKRTRADTASSSSNQDESAAATGKKPKKLKSKKRSKAKTVGETSSKELPKGVQGGMSAYPCLIEVFKEHKNIPWEPSHPTENKAVAKLGPEQMMKFENEFKKIKEAEAEVSSKRVVLTSALMNALKSSSDS